MSILIIYGVDNIEDLKRFGLGIANKYSKADNVLLIDKKGVSYHSKGKNSELDDVHFIDFLFEP